MTGRRLEALAVGAGLGYLVLLAIAMPRVSFDIWGALLLIPIYGLLGHIAISLAFRGPWGTVRVALAWGLFLKLGGAAARYWVGFEAYDGGIDAARYHDFARIRAAEVWSGERSPFDLIPTTTGTDFVDEFTGLLYTLTGGSQLAGFVTFSFIAYLGVICFVRAAATALPDMAVRKYAWLCAIAPSLVYWPASIGKEALVICGLGVATLGIARLLSGGGRLAALVAIGVGLGFAGVIRPHMAGIWVAAAIPALVLAVLRGLRSTDGRRRGRIGFVLVLVGSTIGLAMIAAFTVRFLQPRPGGDQTLTELFGETTRRTAQAGSNYIPPSVDSPLQWPYAIVRTLLRPLPIEARGIAQLVSAVELAGLVALYVWSWRRVVGFPRLLLSKPFVLFVVSAIALTGLAFASFANLGVLTRQKSLLFPLLLLIPCLPLVPRTRASGPTVRERSGPSPLQRPDAARDRSDSSMPGAFETEQPTGA